MRAIFLILALSGHAENSAIERAKRPAWRAERSAQIQKLAPQLEALNHCEADADCVNLKMNDLWCPDSAAGGILVHRKEQKKKSIRIQKLSKLSITGACSLRVGWDIRNPKLINQGPFPRWWSRAQARSRLSSHWIY